MNVTSKNTPTTLIEQKAVDLVGLQAMLGVGRKTAVKIAADAGARCQVGRRILYNVNKIQEYLDKISE